ncbi:fumarylacetoacetate hydrolase family protein [Saccharopolyspora sp. K220]|uniref:fumarylacetoacetate hydrolase family protein n=1 Tax=Saccharopolyspora soli TaxID=2926618 RepID=UPI001F573F29|nr:fumarylacetoacetate hydrolase family protein [Saccharopolyspora soli]MCI2420024.1 fumarylacetoacetate hydrolase family protein [Saccharopolyspora soli]
MRLYRTPRGLARGEGNELLLLDLPHPDVEALLTHDLSLARTASVLERIPTDSAELLAPVAAPGKVVIAGANYLDHLAEAEMPTPSSVVFITVSGEMVVGPRSPILLPAEAPGHVDYEAELAIVVGTPGKGIRAADAWRHVAGLTIVNDVSARDVQLAGMTDGAISDTGAVARGKTFPTFKPLGPAVVTAEEFEQPLDLAITTRVNGELRQNGRTSEMLFSIPEIIETVSASVPLDVGDVVLTGTPSGVALASGAYLRPEDIVDIEIEGIGHLHNTVEAAR